MSNEHAAKKQRDIGATKLSTLLTDLSKLPENLEARQQFIDAASKLTDNTVNGVAAYSRNDFIQFLSLPPEVSDAIVQFVNYDINLFPKKDVNKVMNLIDMYARFYRSKQFQEYIDMRNGAPAHV